MDEKSKRGCLWAAAGGCLLVLIVGGALLAGGAWFIYQNFSIGTEQVTGEDAEAEFERLRARFAGQQPLIVPDEDGRGRLVPREGRASGTIERLHLVAYDPDEGRIARMQMPFWLLRLSPKQGQFSFGHGGDVDLRGVHLSVEDLEAAGPGLVLDWTDERGQRVLMWAEGGGTD
jgi:hypothetical protein